MSERNGSAGPDCAVAAWTLIIRQLSVCSREMRRQLAVTASSVGVSDTEFLLLASLAMGEARGFSQTELAATVGVSTGQVSGLMENLRRGGWIVAETVGDRRRNVWRLTDAGQQLVQQGWHALLERTVEWDRHLGAEQRAELAQLLTRLQGTAQIPGAGPGHSGPGRGTRHESTERKEAA